MNTRRTSRERHDLPESVTDQISEGGPALAADDDELEAAAKWSADIAELSPEVRARLMMKYSIGYDGRCYERDGFRYDALADAVRYARLRSPLGTGGDRHPVIQNILPPTDIERSIMAELGVRFENGSFYFEAFRYERLSDALEYARLKQRLN